MPISQQSKIAIYFLIFITIILGISVWLAFWHIWAAFIPITVIYLIQWIANAFKGIFTPPLTKDVYWLIKWILSKIRAKEPPQQSKSDQPAQVVEFFITSISQWKVLDMLRCSYLGDFSSIGNGSIEKLTEQYNRLIFQYMDAKADPLTERDKELKISRLVASTLYMGVEVNIELLKQLYSPSACKFLRTVNYRLYPKLPLTKESYKGDIKRLEAWLISVKMELDRIDDQLKKTDTTIGDVVKSSFEKKESELQDLIFSINEIFHTQYALSTMVVSELAAGEKRLARHNLMMQERIKKMKTGK